MSRLRKIKTPEQKTSILAALRRKGKLIIKSCLTESDFYLLCNCYSLKQEFKELGYHWDREKKMWKMSIPSVERYISEKQLLFQLANDKDYSVLDTSETFHLPAITIVFSQIENTVRVDIFNAWEIKDEIAVLSDDSTYDTNTKARILKYPIDETHTSEIIIQDIKNAMLELVQLFGSPRNCIFKQN